VSNVDSNSHNILYGKTIDYRPVLVLLPNLIVLLPKDSNEMLLQMSKIHL